MHERKYIPFLSYFNASRIFCEHMKGIRKDFPAGYTLFKLPVDCFYSRSYITAKEYDLETIAGETAKMAADGAPKMLTFQAEDAPEGYERILADHGFIRGFAQHGMVGDIKDLKDFPHPQKGEGRLIIREELREWVHAMTTGFGHGQEENHALYEAIFDNKDTSIYGWFADGRIVGTCIMIEDGDITGLHEGTVQPEYRRLGIISALIRLCAEDSSKRGIKTLSMQGSDMGAPVYASMGFEKTGMIETWIWNPA